MTWFAVFEDATGRLDSLTISPASPLPAGFSSLDLGPDFPDNRTWDTTTRTFGPVVLPNRRVKIDQFFDLFTLAEQRAIFEGAQFGHASYDANVLVFVERVKMGITYDMDGPTAVQALNYLEANGFIAAGRAVEIRQR